MGFVAGCVVFTVVGLVVLRFLPKLRLTRSNLFVFVVGAFPSAAVFGYLHELVFADAEHELHSIVAVLGFFMAMLVGAILGGTTLAWIKARLMKRTG